MPGTAGSEGLLSGPPSSAPSAAAGPWTPAADAQGCLAPENTRFLGDGQAQPSQPSRTFFPQLKAFTMRVRFVMLLV